MTEVDDLENIVNGCKAGQAESFSKLVDIYAKRIYGYFYRLTGNKDVSEELLSEFFARVFEKFKSYKGGSFESWLFKIASNIFNDYLRIKQRDKKLVQGRKAQLQLQRQKANQPQNENIDKLQTQLAKLDADTKELIMLRFYSNLSFKQMAEIRCEPIGTTLSKVHRGLKKLRELME